jgi:hypothetical protein
MKLIMTKFNKPINYIRALDLISALVFVLSCISLALNEAKLLEARTELIVYPLLASFILLVFTTIVLKGKSVLAETLSSIHLLF